MHRQLPYTNNSRAKTKSQAQTPQKKRKLQQNEDPSHVAVSFRLPCKSKNPRKGMHVKKNILTWDERKKIKAAYLDPMFRANFCFPTTLLSFSLWLLQLGFSGHMFWELAVGCGICFQEVLVCLHEVGFWCARSDKLGPPLSGS